MYKRESVSHDKEVLLLLCWPVRQLLIMSCLCCTRLALFCSKGEGHTFHLQYFLPDSYFMIGHLNFGDCQLTNMHTCTLNTAFTQNSSLRILSKSISWLEKVLKSSQNYFLANNTVPLTLKIIKLSSQWFVHSEPKLTLDHRCLL